MSRLILRQVDVTAGEVSKQAVVVLELHDTLYEGRRRLRNEESVLYSVATATLNAVNEVFYSQIHAKIDFNLQHVHELQPPYLKDSLFIAILEAGIGHLSFRLVGAVISNQHDWAQAVASATLDAVNRLVQYILELKNTL
ncbi:MAG: hypothetical protein AB1489_12950 [Acidobacteriota bacterium]